MLGAAQLGALRRAAAGERPAIEDHAVLAAADQGDAIGHSVAIPGVDPALRAGIGRIYAAARPDARPSRSSMAHTRPLSSRLPALPSVFTPHALREGGDAMAEALRRAGEGAGTLAWVGAYARAEAAVVLEPDRPLGEARLALLVAANALADALGVLGPPEVPLGWRWPGTLLVNGGDCGRLRLASPPGLGTASVPDWLVVGFEVALAAPPGREPGADPGRTCLEEEGFAGLGGATLVAGWARQLMAGLDRWEAEGPGRPMADFLARLEDAAGARIDPATGELLRGACRVPLA
ncbi:MAG: hypothetical protein EON47_18545 [Acetobacteraceae bacterium]|nr:MAG: hypothetical protein EON47_18545 [Acetobacteraceae bacterium]